MAILLLIVVVLVIVGSILRHQHKQQKYIPPVHPVVAVHPQMGVLGSHPNILAVRALTATLVVENHFSQALDRRNANTQAELQKLARDTSDPFLQGLQRNGVGVDPTQLDAEQATEVGAREGITGTPTPVVLKPEEPQSLEEYQGQPQISKALSLNIRAMRPEQLLLRHMLLTGLPGFGKTLLAKLVVRTLQKRALENGLGDVQFVETYGANLNSVSAMDQVVDRVLQVTAVVWFIDEIHVMNTDMATKLYLLLEEGRYPFAGSLTPTVLPPIMVIGATTDYGALHPALKRRFGEPFLMQALAPAVIHTLAQQLLPTASYQVWDLVTARCKHSGAPHEIKTLCANIQTYADANQLQLIRVEDALAVFETWGIDEYGLRPIDRQVLDVLRARPRRRAGTNELLGYGASEADVCALAGLDRVEFQLVVRPRLMSRNLIVVRPGLGLALTPTALEWYP